MTGGWRKCYNEELNICTVLSDYIKDCFTGKM
jgi:hypothetical protein